MSPSDELLALVVAETAANGLADRSLRELATAIGSSHRMLLYHFGSRDGLVAAIVDATERGERDLLERLVGEATDVADLMRRLWADVSSPERRPFVRLFFETVGAREQVTSAEPWLETVARLESEPGTTVDPTDVRVAIAVSRGLLLDLLAAGDDPVRADAVHAAHDRFVEAWAPRLGGSIRRSGS